MLLGVVYQTSPQIEEKVEWLDKIETMLSMPQHSQEQLY